MSKIELLTIPASTNRTPEECLGLEYLAAESRINGHSVHFVDAWMNGLSIEEIVKDVFKNNPDVIGISPSMDSIENSKVLVNSLREQNYSGKIILGGIYASFEAENIVRELDGLINGVLTGEADDTFQRFMETGTLEGISGAVYLKNNKIVFEPKTCASDDLDDLPFPARDNLDRIRKIKTPSHVMGSRGCYGNCSFCSVACFQKFSSEKRWRGRSPESIVAELKELSGDGETMVKFIDDNWFGGRDKTRELEIAKRIQEANLNIRFRLSLRVNDVTDELISELKKAGLFAVSLGVESFVPRKLKDYNKGTTVDQNLRAIEILKIHRVFVQMGHIMFDPFITIPEIEEELKFLKQTSWAVTKGICTQIFAAEGTKITERIKNEIGVISKQGTNYLYKIQNPEANIFYEALKHWAKFTSPIYDMVIDPISAPKNIPEEGHYSFHSLCLRLRNLDIDLAERLLTKINSGELSDLSKTVDNFREEKSKEIYEIGHKAVALYEKYELIFNADTNKYIY